MSVSDGIVLSISGFLDGAIVCLDRGGCMGMEQAGAIFPELLHLLPFIHCSSGWRTAVRIERCGFGQSLHDGARTSLFRLGGVLDFVCFIVPEDKASGQEPGGPRVDGLAGVIAYGACLIPVARYRSASSPWLHVYRLDIGYRRVFFGARLGKAQAGALDQPG